MKMVCDPIIVLTRPSGSEVRIFTDKITAYEKVVEVSSIPQGINSAIYLMCGKVIQVKQTVEEIDLMFDRDSVDEQFKMNYEE